MIFIWGIMVFALLLFFPVFVGVVVWEVVQLLREIFQKDTTDNNGYCRDLQREIAANASTIPNLSDTSP